MELLFYLIGFSGFIVYMYYKEDDSSQDLEWDMV
jgi:hypothetical protein